MRENSRNTGQKRNSSKQDKAGAGRFEAAKLTGMDYSVYLLSKKEVLQGTAQYLLLDFCISYLFFYSWKAFLLLLPGAALFLKEKKQSLQKKRKKEMQKQFLDGIQLMSASLQAGYSAENALKEMVRELVKVYGQEACIVQEFRHMETQISMNRNLEELLLDFGRRSGVEDIRSFAEVFLTARRTGGDLLSIIRNTVFCIRQKQETLQEPDTDSHSGLCEADFTGICCFSVWKYGRNCSYDYLSRSLCGSLFLGKKNHSD